MRLTTLLETPLPDNWDSDIFNDRVPFTKRVAYAKERAQFIGGGSSRLAFEIPYQGRRTVLKIAKNRKGMEQNETEIDTLTDWYVRNTGIVIPIIDHDENSNRPTWLHTEFAMPFRDADAKRFFGMTLQELKIKAVTKNFKNEDYDNEYVSAIIDLAHSTNIDLRDISQKSNWGIYKGEPVIVDIGGVPSFPVRR